MKVVVAIDSLKGSLSSKEAGKAAKTGILRAVPDAEVKICPLADGGEGTVDALMESMGGERRRLTVTGPLGKKVECEYGILSESKTAVIEISCAAGITLISDEERNPMYTTTYGVGEVIRDAIEKGCRKFLIGLGGSATNDGGVGMLQALGYQFLDERGEKITLGARGLEYLRSIDDSQVIPMLSECEFRIASDVKNPLCGPKGCSAVYGPQKGADQEMIQKMDKWLLSYAALARQCRRGADSMLPGAGAAGGLGFAFCTFTNASMESGIHLVLEEIGFEDVIRDADMILTGEGRLDGQTAMGKVPVGVAEAAKKYNKPVIAVAGGVTPDAKVCNAKGIDAYFPIVQGVCTLSEVMEPENARANMADTAEQIFRLIACMRI